MLKHLLIGLFAFCTIIGASAAIITENMVLNGGDLGMSHALANVDVATAKQELAAVKSRVQTQGNALAKISFAAATAVVYGKENPNATYAELVIKYENQLKEFGDTNSLKANESYLTYKIGLVHRYHCGSVVPSRVTDAIAANKDTKVGVAAFEVAQLMRTVNMDVEEYAPYYMLLPRGQNFLMRDYRLRKQYDKAAPLFFDLLSRGLLEKDDAMVTFLDVLPYELSKDDFNAADLKAKLNRGIIIYKVKARQWKPAKEDDVNPWLAFLGALQDAAKDL